MLSRKLTSGVAVFAASLSFGLVAQSASPVRSHAQPVSHNSTLCDGLQAIYNQSSSRARNRKYSRAYRIEQANRANSALADAIRRGCAWAGGSSARRVTVADRNPTPAPMSYSGRA